MHGLKEVVKKLAFLILFGLILRSIWHKPMNLVVANSLLAAGVFVFPIFLNSRMRISVKNCTAGRDIL